MKSDNWIIAKFQLIVGHFGFFGMENNQGGDETYYGF